MKIYYIVYVNNVIYNLSIFIMFIYNFMINKLIDI